MQDNSEEVKTYGKFKSAEELLAAYNALEREFTKRCQLIKTLKTAGEHACAQEDTAEVGTSAQTPQPCEKAAKARAEEGAENSDKAEEQITQVLASTDEKARTEKREPAPLEIAAYVAANAEACAELIAEIPQVTDACIAKYKQKLIGMHCMPALRGAAVMTPIRRPKTLEEAKALADEMLL